MIPIGDESKSRITPFINYFIIIACIAVFIWQVSGGRNHFMTSINSYGLIPLKILQGETAYTLVTSMFLHTGLIHLGGNMLFLWVFGDNIEYRLGHLRYLIFYLVSGIAAGITWIFIASSSTRPALGASGAISAVLGAYFVIYPDASVTSLITIFFMVWPIKTPAWLIIGLWFTYQLGLALIAPMAGVAFWIHVAGFIIGLIIARLFEA